MLSDEQLESNIEYLRQFSTESAVWAVDGLTELTQRRAQRCETCRFLTIPYRNDGERWCDLMRINQPDAVTGCVGGWQAKEPR